MPSLMCAVSASKLVHATCGTRQEFHAALGGRDTDTLVQNAFRALHAALHLGASAAALPAEEPPRWVVDWGWLTVRDL